MRGAGAFLILCVLVAACAGTPSRAPVAERSVADQGVASYRVRKGDTLYSIAWRHGLDYRALARRNHIGKPYVIHPGQTLMLRAVARETAPVAAKPRPQPSVRRDWRWPAVGRITRDYGERNKGIDVAVKPGSSIGSVAPARWCIAVGDCEAIKA
ncbi:MAG: LysM peptidoglycan-binding domain-containing protein [Gammaproteobacteria bacterium]|nr:LysM peptidoglycan-binding domain-containing protein [Gammaproteobacteria bacterium]